MAHRTDSITIHDVIEFLQGFDKNDRFLTVIEKEDAFSFFCNLLPLIFRHASQSKLPPQGNSLPRIQRIQKIVALEGIFPELSSSPTYATTSEGSLSSEQNAAPDRNESPQRDTTLEDSEQNAAPDRNESSEHNTTLEDSEQNAAPDRSESSEHNTTLEGSQLLVQSVTQESTSPQQCTSIADNGLCADSSSLQDSAIELSDNEAEEDSLSSSSLLAEGSGEQRQITLGDSQTAANLIPITEDQGEEKTPGFATLNSTIKVSSRFPLWSDSPESFWNYSEGAIEPTNHDLITVPKTFVKDALDKKISNDIKRIQDRFYSIFVYKIYQKLITSPYLSPALISQFLDNLGLPSDPTTHSFCSRLLHGGRRRIEFCQRVTPDRHKIDYGILMIPELEDATWEESNWRVRERCSASVALFKSQNIRSWSKSSGARSAANSIMSSRQPLLDYFQTQYDNIQGQKRRVEFTEGSSFKRIRSDPTTSQSPLQTSPTSLVNDAQAAYNNAQAAFDNADAQAAYDNANQLNLSMRGDESALISSVVSPNIYPPSIINSSSNGHNGMPFQESEFEEMGYEGEFNTYFQELYELYTQLQPDTINTYFS